MKMKKAVVIGAGPAGLTAAYELLNQSDEYEVTVLEEGVQVGGISRTVNVNGNRMDMGGHRFFSKVPAVNEWWERMLPVQGSLPWDDRVLGRTSQTKPGGPDPETTETAPETASSSTPSRSLRAALTRSTSTPTRSPRPTARRAFTKTQSSAHGTPVKPIAIQAKTRT